ncbi:Tetratricopeptide-like helical [Metarhizium album ARSEF 1941]|uniref:Tetratricopeptide-like helical n=1 Tax=Metarhizium album (strain ARSEF 1941) TaxID=1081103 RepID=A0A0B2X3M4_METAS|nr:Tetratricopeptide-like helical [Metarhizium album ARSEF 1941]KHO00025.1 Tetratricopeptide-like helical [Metarhizium album ARSEF 1941]
MRLLDKLKKRDQPDGNADSASKDGGRGSNVADFLFIRTDTAGQEVIQPPNDGREQRHLLSPKTSVRSSPRRSLDVFRPSRSRSESVSSQASHSSRRRLADRLHLGKTAESSENVPDNLPAITGADAADQSQWEQRATMLAGQNELARTRPDSPTPSEGTSQMSLGPGGMARKRSASTSKAIDDDIQDAIRLHEEGKYGQSTQIFRRLADPEGANNPLSQVLYGLALRHGWGCDADPASAVKYLTAAASNSANVEKLALEAGMKKGGANKGELVLAIFELGNCFRYGWGIEKDPVAARQYYETAANLGDSDAMNEAALCYLEGIGGKKDKVSHAPMTPDLHAHTATRQHILRTKDKNAQASTYTF